MPPVIKRTVKRAKLIYLWVTRILCAPNRFNVPLLTRLFYAVNGGFIGDQYALYGLTRKNRREYLSEFDWYRSRWINEPFDSMLNNKIVSNEVLDDLVRVPEVYLIRNKGRITDPQRPNRHLSMSEVLETVRAHGSCFMKPIGSGKGKGVHRIDAVGNAWLLDRREVSHEELSKFLVSSDGWFLSETIDQHTALASLYPGTTNTIRLITMRDPRTGELRVFFAVLRIGTAETVPVDNGSRGGLVANINLGTGELSEARTLWSRQVFTSHPDSGTAIEGFVIPGWHDIMEQMLDVANRLPYLQFVAWDLLLSHEGLVVIEANTSSGVNIIQIWGPQRRGELGDFYREHKVIA